MTLRELIQRLEALDPAERLTPGFGAGHSWRGSYEQVAFTPVESATVGEMLAHARAAVGSTLYGWKGGEYACTLETACNVAAQGEYGGDSDDMGIWWAEHVEVPRLRAALAAAEARAEKAAGNYQFMVSRAADEKLDGYRELGARAAAAEERAEALTKERDEAIAKDAATFGRMVKQGMRADAAVARALAAERALEEMRGRVNKLADGYHWPNDLATVSVGFVERALRSLLSPAPAAPPESGSAAGTCPGCAHDQHEPGACLGGDYRCACPRPNITPVILAAPTPAPEPREENKP